MRLGFVGLGRMGTGMAGRLLKAGHEVTVWNRTASRCEPLRALGAAVASTPSDAARRAEAVITMLADDAAVEGAALGDGGVVEGLPRGACHVSCSTISAALSKRLAEAHSKAGQAYVAAPVFGRPDAAEAGSLFLVAAGPEEAVARLEPICSAIGQRTFRVGKDASAANVVKLAGNFLLASTIESFGEAFALARKSGVEPRTFLEVLTGTLFSAPYQKGYGALIAEGRYRPPGFTLRLGLKDVRLALDAAKDAGASMPAAELLRDRFLEAIHRGLADADWSAVASLSAEDAGLK